MLVFLLSNSMNAISRFCLYTHWNLQNTILLCTFLHTLLSIRLPDQNSSGKLKASYWIETCPFFNLQIRNYINLLCTDWCYLPKEKSGQPNVQFSSYCIHRFFVSTIREKIHPIVLLNITTLLFQEKLTTQS